jgi:hypothetical protein
MGDVQMAFGIIIHCLMQCPLYLLKCTPPFSTFIESVIFFDFFLHKTFVCLLGLRSFDSPERPLAHKQASLPITFGGVRLILTSTIDPTTYLNNWAFVVSIITVRFMVDQRHFFFEALAQLQLIRQQMVQL